MNQNNQWLGHQEVILRELDSSLELSNLTETSAKSTHVTAVTLVILAATSFIFSNIYRRIIEGDTERMKSASDYNVEVEIEREFNLGSFVGKNTGELNTPSLKEKIKIRPLDPVINLNKE